MTVKYADIFNPIGHRFGLLVSEQLILNKSNAKCVSVLFVCDCGKHRRVSCLHIKRRKVPLACERCELATGMQWRNERLPVKETVHSGPMSKKEYTAFVKMHQNLFDIWCNRRKIMVKNWRESFVQFVSDMAPKPPGKVLCRRTLRGLHGTHNSYWGIRGQDTAKRDFHLNGVPVNTEILHQQFGISKHFIRWWRREGLSPAEIIKKWNSEHGST